jgi:hypothetical protein
LRRIGGNSLSIAACAERKLARNLFAKFVRSATENRCIHWHSSNARTKRDISH